MHPSRWGDPDRAAALPDAARGLVELAFGPRRAPGRRATPPLPAPGPRRRPARQPARRGSAPSTCSPTTTTRRLRTRGKSTPDLLRARAGDLADAPDAVVRPGVARRRRRRPGLGRRAPRRRRPLRRRDVGHRRPGRPPRGLRRAWSPSTWSGSSASSRVDHVSMTATLEPGLRGPEAEALLAEEGLTLGHFPQSFEYATIGGFAATRSSGQSSAGYGRFDALVVGLRVATPRGEWVLGSLAGQRRRPRPAPARARLRGRLRRHHRGHRAGAPGARRHGLRGLAVAVVRRRRRRDAHPRPGRHAADRDPALRRERDRDQPGQARRHRRVAPPAAA